MALTHTSGAESRPFQAPNPSGQVAPREKLTTSVIGNDLCILGHQVTIITQGALQVDGQLQANVHGIQVTISEQGKVDGTIVGQTVSIAGEVSGIVRGLQLELKSTAKVDGEIHHQTLTIAEGAHFEGEVRRPKETKELMPVLDRVAHEVKGYAASALQHSEAPTAQDSSREVSAPLPVETSDVAVTPSRSGGFWRRKR